MGESLQSSVALSSPVISGESRDKADGGFGTMQLCRKDKRQESTWPLGIESKQSASHSCHVADVVPGQFSSLSRYISRSSDLMLTRNGLIVWSMLYSCWKVNL